MNTKTKTSKCSICDSEINGFGNNPQPVSKNNKPLEISERCCDDCNLAVVMPVREFDFIPGDVSDAWVQKIIPESKGIAQIAKSKWQEVKKGGVNAS